MRQDVVTTTICPIPSSLKTTASTLRMLCATRCLPYENLSDTCPNVNNMTWSNCVDESPRKLFVYIHALTFSSFNKTRIQNSWSLNACDSVWITARTQGVLIVVTHSIDINFRDFNHTDSNHTLLEF